MSKDFDSDIEKELRNAAAELRREVSRAAGQARRDVREAERELRRERSSGANAKASAQAAYTETTYAEPALSHVQSMQPQPVPPIQSKPFQEVVGRLRMGLNSKARQGLQVYALNRLSRLSAGIDALGLDAATHPLALVWLSDETDGARRVGLRAEAIAEIDGETWLLDDRAGEVKPAMRCASAGELEWLATGERVTVTPASWSQVQMWEDFGRGFLHSVVVFVRKQEWLMWIIALILAVRISIFVLLAWWVISKFLQDEKDLQPYRAAYFEDGAAPKPIHERLWHMLDKTSLASAMLLPAALRPQLEMPNFADSTEVHTPVQVKGSTTSAATATPDLLQQLPDDLAAGLRMVRERVADLPEESIPTPRGHYLRQLDDHCEEAARLYLELPEGTPAKAEAEAEVRHMLEDVLEELARAGSRSQQQADETLRAIRDLRERSTRRMNDPLRLE